MDFSSLYTVGKDSFTSSELDKIDPRGLVCMFEPPIPNEQYVMGIDPTVGIVGWDRNFRSRDDIRTDNGAIEIIRVGRSGKPDVQVCEYAAPIDPEELADIANALGRLYHGAEEEALCIIEVYPGPGLLTQRKMINALGYSNMFVWKYLGSASVQMSNNLGWQSSQKSVRDLWIRGTRHITLDKVRITSNFLADELAYCEPDALKMTARAASGKHDDRARAFLMAIWAAHDWNYQIEERPVEVNAGKEPDWQRSAISADKMFEAWERRFAEISEDYS